MADIRSIAGPSLVPQAQLVARSEAVRAAQRAFFQAALAGENTTPAAPAHATPVKTVQTTAPEPGRLLRPGSIVDIKV